MHRRTLNATMQPLCVFFYCLRLALNWQNLFGGGGNEFNLRVWCVLFYFFLCQGQRKCDMDGAGLCQGRRLNGFPLHKEATAALSVPRKYHSFIYSFAVVIIAANILSRAVIRYTTSKIEKIRHFVNSPPPRYRDQFRIQFFPDALHPLPFPPVQATTSTSDEEKALPGVAFARSVQFHLITRQEGEFTTERRGSKGKGNRKLNRKQECICLHTLYPCHVCKSASRETLARSFLNAVSRRKMNGHMLLSDSFFLSFQKFF